MPETAPSNMSVDCQPGLAVGQQRSQQPDGIGAESRHSVHGQGSRVAGAGRHAGLVPDQRVRDAEQTCRGSKPTNDHPRCSQI